MRYLSVIRPGDLSLTDEEIKFLQPEAGKYVQEVFELNSDKLEKCESIIDDSFYGVIGKKYHQENELVANKILTYFHVLNKSEVHKEPWNVEKVDENGFGIKHESYAVIGLNQTSNKQNSCVGSFTLSNYGLAITVSPAEVYDNERIHSSPYPHAEFSMSVEQFCSLIRGGNEHSVPCAIKIREEGFSDYPPSFFERISDSNSIMDKINKLLVPVDAESKKFIELINSGVSKKSDYASLMKQCESYKAAVVGVIADVEELFRNSVNNEFEREKRQFYSDISERFGHIKLADDSLRALLGSDRK